MTCKKCRTPMKELRGTHHRKRKFRCPSCGRHGMQITNQRRRTDLAR